MLCSLSVPALVALLVWRMWGVRVRVLLAVAYLTLMIPLFGIGIGGANILQMTLGGTIGGAVWISPFVIWRYFQSKRKKTPRSPSSDWKSDDQHHNRAIRAFLQGDTNTLRSSDIDPEGAERLGTFQRAMALKAEERYEEAAELLVRSCEPPSIFQGHYRELFMIWRKMNRSDLQDGKLAAVVQRVMTMIRYDNEMIDAMLGHWSTQQHRELPNDYFDKDRNLKVTDAKALLKAATALGKQGEIERASALIETFSNR